MPLLCDPLTLIWGCLWHSFSSDESHQLRSIEGQLASLFVFICLNLARTLLLQLPGSCDPRSVEASFSCSACNLLNMHL